MPNRALLSKSILLSQEARRLPDSKDKMKDNESASDCQANLKKNFVFLKFSSLFLNPAKPIPKE